MAFYHVTGILGYFTKASPKLDELAFMCMREKHADKVLPRLEGRMM